MLVSSCMQIKKLDSCLNAASGMGDAYSQMSALDCPATLSACEVGLYAHNGHTLQIHQPSFGLFPQAFLNGLVRQA